MQEKGNVSIKLVGVLIIIFVVVVLGIMFFMNKEQENNNVSEGTLDEITNIKEELDKSIDERKETIMLEGMEESITTLKYVSSVGYSMRYEKESFIVSKDEGMDVYSCLNNDQVCVTVEGYQTPYETAINSLEKYSKTNINGNEAASYSKIVDGTLQTYYYIKAEAGVIIITTYYPNTPEYVEGWGNKIDKMIQTFEIQ